MIISVIFLFFAALVASAPIKNLLPRQITCYSGVYVIGARGSDEDPGFGSVDSVVSGVLAAIPDSGSIALDYPASVLDPFYDDSVSDGVNTMIGLIQSYVDSCYGKIVLVGFSQGGNVVTDTLAGGVDKPTPISANYASYSEFFQVNLACKKLTFIVSAVTVFGDPTFTHGQSFDDGTDTSSDGVGL
jgi:acetylxylan esterase